MGLDPSRLWAGKSEQVSHDWEEEASGHRREAEGADGDVHLLRLNRGGRCLEKIGLDLREGAGGEVLLWNYSKTEK